MTIIKCGKGQYESEVLGLMPQPRTEACEGSGTGGLGCGGGSARSAPPGPLTWKPVLDGVGVGHTSY